jgi:adenylate cyclase
LTIPRTLDERIVIVDIDEKILPVGRWPWNRQNGGLVNELIERQRSASGFDVVLQRPD